VFLRITIGVCIAVLISSAWHAAFPLIMRSASNLALWLLFWGMALGSGVFYILRHREWPRSVYPFLVCATTLFAVFALPFNNLSRYLEFREKRVPREAIVRDREAGRILPIDPPGGLLIQAPPRTIDGHDIALIEIDGHPTVFFYSWWTSDTWEGWLYVPTGANPDHFNDYGYHKRWRLDDHWIYFGYR
jgi:hypothetical protein